MTELAALNIKITGDSTDLKAAIAAANGDLAKLVAGAEAAGLKVSKIPFKPVGDGAGKFANSIRGVTQQLSQVGQQTMATGNFLQALAIQLPDIGLAFGAVGTAVGLVAGVALPMVINAMTSTGAEVVKFSDTLDGLTSITDQLKASQDILAMSLPDLYEKYGIYAGAVRDAAAALNELNIAEAQNALAKAVTDSAAALGQYAGAAATAFSSGTTMTQGLINIRDQFGLIGGEAQRLQGAFSQLQSAVGFDEQAVAARNLTAIMKELGVPVSLLPSDLRAALIQANQLTIAGSELKKEMQDAGAATSMLSRLAPQGGWLSGAISDAAALASTLWDAAAAQAATGKSGNMTYGNANFTKGRTGFTLPGSELIPPDAPGTQGGRGGGGSAAANQLQTELQTLQESLMTQEQLQMESYTRQQETLKAALDQRLLSQQEYAALMEQVEKTHQLSMTKETNAGVQATLGHLGQLFSGSKKIGAAIALANSWLAFTEVLKDPAYTGRPFARFAAAGAALSSGLNAVRNIKSASPGGSAGGGGGAGAAGAGGGAAPQQNVQTLNFTLTNDSFGIGQNLIRQIAAQLNESQRNGSTLIRATVS